MYNFNERKNISFEEVKHEIIAMIFDIIGQAYYESVSDGSFSRFSTEDDEYGVKWLHNWADDAEEIASIKEDTHGLNTIKKYCSRMGWDFAKA